MDELFQANSDAKLATPYSRNEVTLNALRSDAIEDLIKKGIESSSTSTARTTAQGLEVNTTDNKTNQQSKMVVSGAGEFEAGFHGFHTDDQWKGNFTIKSTEAGKTSTEKATFDYSGSMWDNIWGRTDKANVTMARTSLDGKPLQTYLPASSEEVIKNGSYVMDPNGQPLRIAKEAGSSANCQLDMSNSRGGNYDCNYLIRDPRLGKDISYNETRKQWPNGGHEFRAVLRDTSGKVLGIVNQNFRTDSAGNLTEVQTSARKPMDLRK